MELDVTLHRNSPVPLYHQLAAQLKHAVESGEVAKGTFLGNELDLADRWQVSRPTVRRAIQDLVDAVEHVALYVLGGVELWLLVEVSDGEARGQPRLAVANMCRYLDTGVAERLVTDADRP